MPSDVLHLVSTRYLPPWATCEGSGDAQPPHHPGSHMAGSVAQHQCVRCHNRSNTRHPHHLTLPHLLVHGLVMVITLINHHYLCHYHHSIFLLPASSSLCHQPFLSLSSSVTSFSKLNRNIKGKMDSIKLSNCSFKEHWNSKGLIQFSCSSG